VGVNAAGDVQIQFWEKPDGTPIVPFFSSLERLHAWLCQTGKGGAPGPFSFRRWSRVFPFHWPLGEFQVGLCHASDPWRDGHISSSIALAMKVWFGHTAHSQSQHSYHPSIGAEN